MISIMSSFHRRVVALWGPRAAQRGPEPRRSFASISRLFRGSPAAFRRIWRQIRLRALAPTLLVSDDDTDSGSISEEDELLLAREWRVHAAAALILIILMCCVLTIVLFSPVEDRLVPSVFIPPASNACPQPPPSPNGHSIMELIVSSPHALLCGVPGMRSTMAAETALRARGSPFEFVAIDGPPVYALGASPTWDFLRCKFPMAGGRGAQEIPQSYVFVQGRLVGNGFVAANAIQRGLLDRPLGLTSMTCEERFPDEAITFRRFQEDVNSRVLLFGWLACPCTFMAMDRFSGVHACYAGMNWEEPTSPLMAYLQCKEGSPLDHSFVYFRESLAADSQWRHIGNGFQLDVAIMAAPVLENYLRQAGAHTSCLHLNSRMNIYGEPLEPCGLTRSHASAAVTMCNDQSGDLKQICAVAASSGKDKLQIAEDTPNWLNPFGANCRMYKDRNWCFNKSFVAGSEWTGKLGARAAQCVQYHEPNCARLFGYPSFHCVECGKSWDTQGTCVPLKVWAAPVVYDPLLMLNCMAIPETALSALLPRLSAAAVEINGVRALQNLLSGCLEQANSNLGRRCALQKKSLELFQAVRGHIKSRAVQGLNKLEAKLMQWNCSTDPVETLRREHDGGSFTKNASKVGNGGHKSAANFSTGSLDTVRISVSANNAVAPDGGAMTVV